MPGKTEGSGLYDGVPIIIYERSKSEFTKFAQKYHNLNKTMNHTYI